MKSLVRIPSALTVAAALCAGGAMAQEVAQEALPANGVTTEVAEYGDIRYVTGGIGDSDVARTRQLARGMNLELVFAQMNGDYLADVDVALHDGKGDEVLRVDGADPLLFAQMPPGRYVVKAQVEGKAVEREVVVPDSGRRTEFLHWRGSM